MHTRKCRSSVDIETLPSENEDYPSVISPVALVDIHPLICKCESNGFFIVILNGMQDPNAFT